MEDHGKQNTERLRQKKKKNKISLEDYLDFFSSNKQNFLPVNSLNQVLIYILLYFSFLTNFSLMIFLDFLWNFLPVDFSFRWFCLSLCADHSHARLHEHQRSEGEFAEPIPKFSFLGWNLKIGHYNLSMFESLLQCSSVGFSLNSLPWRIREYLLWLFEIIYRFCSMIVSLYRWIELLNFEASILFSFSFDELI